MKGLNKKIEKINVININEQFEETRNVFISCMTVLIDKRLVICSRKEIQILQIDNNENEIYKDISILNPHKSINPFAECVSYVIELSPNVIASTGYGCVINPSIKIWKLYTKTYEQIGSVYAGFYIKCIFQPIENEILYSVNSKSEIIIWNKHSYQVCTYISTDIEVIQLGIKLKNENVLIVNDMYDNLIKFDVNVGKKVGVIEDVCCFCKGSIIEIPNKKIMVGMDEGLWIIDIQTWKKEYKFIMNLEQIHSFYFDNEMILCGLKKGFHYKYFTAYLSILGLNLRNKPFIIEERKICENEVTAVDVLSQEIIIVSKIGFLEIYKIC